MPARHEPIRPETARVLLADEHSATRAAMKALLERHSFPVCAEVIDAPAAVQAALSERPDICLIEMELPGGGVAAATQITQSLPDAAVVMLSDSRDGDDVLAALRAGASGYLLKDMNPDRLPQALRGVLAGEVALPRALAARLVEELRKPTTRRFPIEETRGVELTAREWDVLDLMRENKSTGEIATRLFVSPVTVRTHISSLVRKLNVPNRNSVIKLVMSSDRTNGARRP